MTLIVRVALIKFPPDTDTMNIPVTGNITE